MSLDTFLGGPYNVASYSLLLHLFANVANLIPNEFIWTPGDTHIYKDQLETVNEYLSREPVKLPRIRLKRKLDSVMDFRAEDVEILDYNPHPTIKKPKPAV